MDPFRRLEIAGLCALGIVFGVLFMIAICFDAQSISSTVERLQ